MKGQFPAVIQLKDLNGQNGFKIDGENINDWSGNSVNAVGDINGDGYDDFLIGAFGYPGWNQKGRSYVVFGGPKVGGNGILLLSSLNGTNGFKLDGENNNDRSGSSVSAVGDINGDGHADLLITAPLYPAGSYRGCSYVVFGGPQVGSTGAIALSSLNGTNGFKLDGENNNDINSFSVSGIGDINNDGHPDLLIGAIAYPSGNYTGRSYVVFGGPQVGNTGAVALLSLNGTNGFKLDGENKGDQVGASVSGGDINGDGHADLLIGAYHYLGGNSRGRSYVVFGGSGVGSGGIIALSNLNGANGFKLDGENNNDLSACSVSTLDINADGIADLLIGAPFYPSGNGTGRSYVIFGGSAVGNNGSFSLSELNGINGFILNGEHNSDYSGYSVKAAGDVNGDGYADLLISAYGYPMDTYKGRSYVVFGGPGVGSGGVIALSGLDGTNGFKLDGENDNDVNNAAVSAAGDVNADGVADLLIGADGYPKGNNTGRTYVVFGDAPPVLVNNKLNVVAGSSVTLSYINLAVYDRNHNNQTLVFLPTGMAHGYFSTTSAPSIPLVNFTQQQITNGMIQFVHDGTQNPPSYNMSVYSAGIAWTGPWPAQIAFNLAQSYFPTILLLSSLNGQNGFKVDGENNGDQSGISVRAAGDINGDGHADLLIGADSYNSSKGGSYVVFGDPKVGDSGDILLASLNGSNGFKLDGENNQDFSGSSVSAAGDLNSDGHGDLIVGAYGYPSGSGKGRSYVMFGGPSMVGSGALALSNLTGVNGFKLDGENNQDFSGSSVSTAGDINGDGHTDLIVGAQGYPSNGYKGRSYVVFGGTDMVGSGTLALFNLTGANGFKLDGENNGDYSGRSVSAAGDINGDNYADLIIGAPYCLSNSQKGRSYVVFGGPGMIDNGTLSLSNLTGANGFKLDGENTQDYSGISVSTAGDFNGDGYADLIIGAYGYPSNSQKGRSYVVFGGPGVGSSENISLASLNGTNGFKLDGENIGDWSGYSVSAAGDINGDGYKDVLIGAYHYTNQTGRSYVVFGSVGVVGSNGTLALSNLTGANGFKLDGENNGDYSGYSVSTAGDINGDGVADIVMGAYGYPKANSTGRTYVLFGDIPPFLVKNALQLTSGATIHLNINDLLAYDLNNNNNTIVFVPSNIIHGYFELSSQPGVAVTNFTQPALVNGSVQFVHDGSSIAPSYNMTVYSAGIAWTGPVPANITFIPAATTATPTPTVSQTATPSVTGTATPSTSQSSTPVHSTPTPSVTPTPTPISAPPVLLNNQLTLSNGQTVVLSSNNLKASEAGFNNSRLIFVVGNVQNGYFATVSSGNSPSKNTSSFTQAQIASGAIEFVSTGNSQSPSYSVLVSDGVQTTSPNTATVYFAGAPIITQNTLNITVDETITLTPALLNVTVTDGSTATEVLCQVQDLQHAIFTQLPSSAAITNFTLSDLQAGRVQVTQDGSNIAPSYLLSCGGKTSVSSAPVTVITQFSDQGVVAPQIISNNLFITQGSTVVLNSQNVDALQNSTQPLSPQAKFFVSEVTHGYFSISSLPGFIANAFTQSQLHNGSVQFTQDNSLSPPSYRLAVLALGLESASLPATIFFRPVNQPPRLVNSLTDQTATVGEPFTYAIPTDSFVDPEGESLTYQVSRYNSSTPLPGWLHFEESSQRFIGTPALKDFIDVNVSAQDPEGLSTTTDFTINVISASAGSGFTTWEKTILGALISGGIGIGFAVAQICLKRMANKKLLQVLGEGDSKYDQEVVRPVAKEIAQRLKITRFMNATTNKELMAFKSAVRSLLSALSDKGVDLNFSEMKDVERDKTINEIGNQTYRWVKANQRGCAARCPGLHAFFKPQLQPEELRGAAEEIADQVASALRVKKSRAEVRLSARLSVSGSPVFKELEDKQSMELREIDSPSKKGAEPEELPEPVVLN